LGDNGFVLRNFGGWYVGGFDGGFVLRIFFFYEGTRWGWGFEPLVLELAELFEGAVQHGLEAVFGFVELVVGVGVFAVGFGSFGECAGGGGIVGMDGGKVEGGVGLDDAVETPGQGDGAVGEVELRGGLGGEGG